MFRRPDRETSEPVISDATPRGNDRHGSNFDASDEELTAMPALANQLESTRYASPPDIEDSRRKAHSASRFAYSTGDQPLPGFTIKRGIGVGGFGDVYFAISEAGKEVAMKRVQRNLDIELRGVSHCINIKHPNLIALYDTRYDANEQAWVIMEYVAGETLRDVLDRHPHGLPRGEVRRWFGDLAAGVACLHENGIVHRDLKPGNVFDDEGIVKIGDYGLSKYISCSRRGGHTESVGTFHYMAPEIGRGEYGKEIDVYALGIMLFEMLTGDVPFNGESSQEIIMKHLTSDPDLSGIEQPYRAVIDKALQKNPQSRQQNVAEMLQPLGLSIGIHGLAQDGSVGAPVVATVVPDRDTVLPAEVLDSPKTNNAFNKAFHDNTRAAFDRLQSGKPMVAPTVADQPVAPQRAVDESKREPIARAVSQSAQDFSLWWKNHHMSPIGKAFVLAVACVVLMTNAAWLIPLVSLLAVLYVPYYVIRTLVLSARDQPSYANAHASAVAAHRNQQMRPTVAQWRLATRRELATKSHRLRAAELTESWMTSLVVLALLGWAATMFGISGDDGGPRAIAPYVWGAMTALGGTWLMLAMGKIWEREEGEGLPRRIVQLGLGAVVGAFAFAIGNGLMIPMDEGFRHTDSVWDMPEHMYATDGAIKLPAMMAYFATIFFVVRWWRNADPLRSRRLSVWSVACVVVAAWVTHQFIPVPQPWGMLTAGSTCLAVQMAASWRNPMERLQKPTMVA